MTDRQALSKGELEVARVLWKLRSGTVRQVHEAMEDVREIDFTTVQTYLRRLEAKGYVHGKMAGRVLVYAPKVKPGTVIKETVNDLVNRLFGGTAMPLVRHLIEDGGLTQTEIDELRKLLDNKEVQDED